LVDRELLQALKGLILEGGAYGLPPLNQVSQCLVSHLIAPIEVEFLQEERVGVLGDHLHGLTADVGTELKAQHCKAGSPPDQVVEVFVKDLDLIGSLLPLVDVYFFPQRWCPTGALQTLANLSSLNALERSQIACDVDEYVVVHLK
jgi:hypothetical protein